MSDRFATDGVLILGKCQKVGKFRDGKPVPGKGRFGGKSPEGQGGGGARLACSRFRYRGDLGVDKRDG